MPSEVSATENGGGHRATNSVVIDGVRPERLVRPGSAQEIADLLADAAAQGKAVAPMGGQTSLELGNVPDRLDVALSTSNLGGIIDYEPTDLVLSVGAGAVLGDVQAVLAEHGQMLPIDPPRGDAATIGGLIATALAGPRRLSAGTLRDLLIGISVAHPSGTVTKAGGMVVKNVSGFDLPRLYHGALGTLGVIVSANFKVLPVPRAETTVVRAVSSLFEALAATRRIRESRLMPDALEAAFFDGRWIAAVRLTGREGSLPPVVDEARALLGGEVETIDGRDSATWWRQYVDDQAISVNARQVLLRLTVRPRQTGSLAETLVRTFEIKGLALLGLAASVGMGSVVARVEFPEHGNAAGDVMDLQQQLFALADHVTILAAPPEWKQGLDVWGRPPEALDVMRALKEQFDPARVLNPGRFAGFI